MSAAEKLLKRFEANIRQSLGVRDAEPAGAEPRPREPRPAGPADGRLRARSLGLMDVRNIAPDPAQPRKDFDEEALGRLSRSMAKFGQLLPIRVRWDDGLGKWVIISGERRYRAALRAGLEAVTCHFVDEELTPSRVLEEQVVENALREDLKPVEQARAYRALMEANGWSARRVAEELHVASSTIIKALALLKLPEDVRERVDSGAIPQTAAYELAKLGGDGAMREAARRISDEKLSREDAVRLVRAARGEGRPAPPRPAARPVATASGEPARLEFTLSEGKTLTVEPGEGLTAGALVAGLEAILEDLRPRLGRPGAAGRPWRDGLGFRRG